MEPWKDVLRVEFIDVEEHPDKNEYGLQLRWDDKEISSSARFGSTNILNVAKDPMPSKDSIADWSYKIMILGMIVGMSGGNYSSMRFAKIAAEQRLAYILKELRETELEIHGEE